MKKYIFKILRYSGLPFLFRELIQKHKITILMFHDISADTAQKSFSYLLNKYNVIGLNEFIDAHERKNLSMIPKKALIITFDDGHVRNYEMLSILKKNNVPITIFLCSAIINTNRNYWFQFNKLPIDVERLKLKSNKERLEILSDAGFEQEKEFSKPQALQKDHIRDMKPYVNFQSHTMFHPILPKCNNAVAYKEIVSSKEMLETEYGLAINAFAYPNGDYSERDISLIKKAGYKCAITVDYGFNSIKSNMFRLKRLSVNDANDINEFIVKSSGLWAFLKTRNGKKQEYGLTNKTE